MARKHVAFEWQVLADHVEPDDVNARPRFDATARQALTQAPARWLRLRTWWGLAALVITLTVATGVVVRRDEQAQRAALAAALRRAVVPDRREAPEPATIAVAPAPALASFALRNGVAAVKLIADDPARPLPYRETHFLRRDWRGWQPTTTDADFWGSPQQLTSRFFTIRYYAPDAAAVTAAASPLDTLYQRLHQALGRPLPQDDEPIVIEVLPSAGFERGVLPVARKGPIQLASPSVLWIPAHVSDTDAVVWSGGIALLYRLLPQDSGEWGARSESPDDWWWPSLTDGLRLWLFVDSNPHVRTHWHAVLSWYLAEPCRSCSFQLSAVPAGVGALCQTVVMLEWNSPELFIALPCGGLLDLVTSAAGSPGLATAPSRRSRRPPPIGSDDSHTRDEAYWLRKEHVRQAISMVTLLEYVASTYGRDRIPEFLAAFGAHPSWDALLADTFAVPVEVFETGWRDYLKTQYAAAEP